MIKIGTSGFSFPDWRGTVYPKKLQPKDALQYYQNELGFDCVEINSTYYNFLPQKSFMSMASKTNPDFEFVVKAYKGMTHDPFDLRLADKKPGIKKANEDTDRFIYSIAPLKEKNKLGVVLMQFPVFFYPQESSKDYILQCSEKFKDIPLVIEFRNNTWAKDETFEFLQSNKLSYCIVDEPALPRLMPFINKVTSDTAYVRFHGRNKNWFNAPLSERYDYMYSQTELESFIPEIKKIDKNSRKTFLFFNNCHAGSAAKNARTLKGLLGLKSDQGKLF